MDNSTDPTTQQNVSPTIDNIEEKKYDFKCVPSQNVKGNIYLSQMSSGNDRISLNMIEDNSDYIDYKVEKQPISTTTLPAPLVKRNNPGLIFLNNLFTGMAIFL